MKTSARGINLIQQFEGLELEAYQDIAGIWTIGYGHTGPDVEPGMRITEKEAIALLQRDLTPREKAVDDLTSVPLNQNEFDALVSFIYNVGINAYRGSTARKRLNRKDRMGAADALTWWNKATVGGVLREVQGLTRRRASERALFLTPTNPPLVRANENLDENTRATPVEDSPRRSNPAESRTVQGATVAGGAGVAASTMGQDNAEELEQLETNIENGTGMTEDDSAGEGSTPPPSAIAGSNNNNTPTDGSDDDTETDDHAETPGDDDDAAAHEDCLPPPDEDGEALADDDIDDTDTVDEDVDADSAPEPELETCDIIVDTGEDTDPFSHNHDTFGEDEHGSGEIIMDGIEHRPSKHEVHAVEAQIQFALLVLIILSVGYVIYARIEDWFNYRR